jgi:hypothetical protein
MKAVLETDFTCHAVDHVERGKFNRGKAIRYFKPRIGEGKWYAQGCPVKGSLADGSESRPHLRSWTTWKSGPYLMTICLARSHRHGIRTNDYRS